VVVISVLLDELWRHHMSLLACGREEQGDPVPAGAAPVGDSLEREIGHGASE